MLTVKPVREHWLAPTASRETFRMTFHMTQCALKFALGDIDLLVILAKNRRFPYRAVILP